MYVEEAPLFSRVVNIYSELSLKWICSGPALAARLREDGEDGNGLKKIMISQFFQVLKLASKNGEKIWLVLPAKFHLISSS